jgi:hypothetical protein
MLITNITSPGQRLKKALGLGIVINYLTSSHAKYDLLKYGLVYAYSQRVDIIIILSSTNSNRTSLPTKQ